MLAIIVALCKEKGGKRNVIGNKGEIPWGRLPFDLKIFKALTIGHSVLFGAKTLSSIGRGLSERKIFVLTHNPGKFELYGDGVTAISNLDNIFELAKNTCVYVGGGEVIYEQLAHKADIAYITRIDAEFEGDAFFPELKVPEWKRIDSSNERDCGYDLCFEIWARGQKERFNISNEAFMEQPTCGSNRIHVITSLSR